MGAAAMRHVLTELEYVTSWLLHYALFPVVHLTQAELDALPEYSCTTPTWVFPGKRWKRNVHFGMGNRQPPAWLQGEYLACPDDDARCTVRWSRVEVVAPRPADSACNCAAWPCPCACHQGPPA